MKNITIVLLLVTLLSAREGRAFPAGPGSPAVHNCDVYRGYLSGDMATWTEGILAQEKKFRMSGSSDDLYVLVLSKYGYIGYLINLKRETDVRVVLAGAESDVERLAADKRYAAVAAALRGALLAMKISLNPLKATYLGMRSLRSIEESLRIDPAEPTGWVEMGNARYHMPAVVGGSYQEAVRCFSEAVRLFESRGDGVQCNWHYLHALVWMAKSHEEMGNLDEARLVYEKLLRIEPGFQWVKTELYPQLMRRMGQGK